MNKLCKEQQEYAISEWNYWQKADETNFRKLIEKSTPIYNDKVCIKTNDRLLGDTDVYIDIKTQSCCTSTWVSSAENNINSIWRFMEALTFPNREYFFSCSNEGPRTFFYVKTLENNNIRFVLITNGTGNSDKTDYFKIKHDFVVDKKQFIAKLYKSFYETIANSKVEDMMHYNVDEFEDLNKDSLIIRKYLEL